MIQENKKRKIVQNRKLYNKTHQRKALNEVQMCNKRGEKVRLSVSSVHAEDSQTGSSEIPPLSVGYRGDVSPGPININHMCLVRNVCASTRMPRFWKTHTHAITHNSVCFICIIVFMSAYTSVSTFALGVFGCILMCVNMLTQLYMESTYTQTHSCNHPPHIHCLSHHKRRLSKKSTYSFTLKRH